MRPLLSSDKPSQSAGATLTKYFRLSYLLTVKCTAPGSEAGDFTIKAHRESMHQTVSHRRPSVCPHRVGGAPWSLFREDTNSIHEVPPPQLSGSHQSVYSVQDQSHQPLRLSEWPFSCHGAARTRAHTSQCPYARSHNPKPYSCPPRHCLPLSASLLSSRHQQLTLTCSGRQV